MGEQIAICRITNFAGLTRAGRLPLASDEVLVSFHNSLSSRKAGAQKDTRNDHDYAKILQRADALAQDEPGENQRDHRIRAADRSDKRNRTEPGSHNHAEIAARHHGHAKERLAPFASGMRLPARVQNPVKPEGE